MRFLPPLDFGPVEARSRRPIDLVAPWLEGVAPPVNRLALGAILISPVPNRRAGLAALAQLVPSLNINPDDDVSDLLFQINRPEPRPLLIIS